MRTTFTLSLFFSLMLFSAVSQPVLWGLAAGGGTGNYGTLFSFNVATASVTVHHNFTGYFSGDGGLPYGSLMLASNGKMYGMTYQGGSGNVGIIFEYNPATSVYTKKIDFAGSNTSTGTYPQGSLMQASNGKLYGLTGNGGVNGGSTGYGVLFEYDISTNTLTKKFDFDGTAHGRFPYGTLVEAPNGKFYGLTYQGGVSDAGTLFMYDPSTQTVTKKHDFTSNSDGGNPYGSLFLASNGKLYGLTKVGATTGFGYGSIFEFDPATDAYTMTFGSFNVTNGQTPLGSFCQAANGKLYATASAAGAFTNGVILEYDIATATYTNKHDFNNLNGAYPWSTLRPASNGKLYGVTSNGGPGGSSMGDGVIFEFDPATATYVNVHSMSGTSEGKNMKYMQLLEYNAISSGIEPMNAGPVQLGLYPNPANAVLNVSCTSSAPVAYTIVDATGRAVKEGMISGHASVDISGLDAGLYVMQAGGSGRRFVKE